MADTVYNSTGGVNATTPTDPTKKKNLNLPYMQTGQNQVMPLASTAVNAGANAQGQPTGQLAPMQQLPQMNQQQMVQNTYQQATQQKQDPLQSLIGNTYAQQIQDYGQNAQQNVQNTLENYDVQKAKAFEAARQAGAGAADSGIFQNDLLQTQLQNLRDRGNIEQQTKTANLENLNKVLSGAQTASTQQQTANDQFMKNLIAATQAGEGEANRQQAANEASLGRAQELLVQANDIQGNKDIETLKGKIAAGQATTDYERAAAEKAIDRAHEIALQKGDTEGAKELETLKGQIQAGLQATEIQGNKDIETLRAKLEAGQATTDYERAAAEKALDRAHETALQKGDNEAAKEIETLKGQIQSMLQKEQFVQQSKENALDRTNALLLSNNDIQGNKDLTILKSKLDADQITTNYERQQAMDALSRAHDIAMQNGDIAGKMAIEKLQGEITSQINKETQAWQTGERVASQAFATTERMSTQDFESGQKYLDRQNQKSMQMQEFYNNLDMKAADFRYEEALLLTSSDLEEAKANNDFGRTEALTKLQTALQKGLQDDAQEAAKEIAQLEISNQRYLADQNAQLQIKMQLQGFAHDDQLRFLDSQIAEVKANGDVERQRQLMGYQTQLNLQELGAKAGYDEKKAYLDNELAKALQDNDAVHAEVLQRARLDQEALQFTEEMVVKRAAQALEEKKVDIAQVENDYNKVVEMFGEDSEAAHEFLINTLNANGIDTSGNEYAFVDATEQAKKSLQAEYDLQKDQYLQTHPDSYMRTLQGKEYSYSDILEMFGGEKEWADKQWNMMSTTNKISPDAITGLNEFINSAIYGEETAAQKEAKKTAGYLVNNAANTANVGDSLNITEATKTTAGQTLPVGLYDVINKSSSKSDLWRSRTDNVVIAKNRETGQEYEIRTDKGGESKKIGAKLLDPLGIFG